MSKQKDLHEKSKSYFENAPKAKLFYATEDGCFFSEKNRDAWLNHAIKHKLERFTFKRGQVLFQKEEVKEAEKQPETPTDKWKNDDIKSWMEKQEIAFDSDDTKKELLAKIQKAKTE